MAQLFPLPILLEILINGTWTDITSYVYNRDPIVITGGRSTSITDTQSPATMTVTLNNRDGRFSPNYASGAYYPYLNRNTQIRLSINNAQSSSGNTYSGYRFWGKVTDWPPLSDISGKDIYVQIAPSGPLRKVAEGGGKGSALTRYYQTLTGSYAPIAYWPCEEETGTDQLGAGIDGGTNMTVTVGTPTFKTITFNGGEPIGVLNYSTWDGLTGAFGTSGDDIFTAAGTFTWVASTTSGTYKIFGGGGGGSNGVAAAGGGGGGYSTGTFATTPGNQYTVRVAGGGQGGDGSQNSSIAGGNGGQSQFTDDSTTHSAPGGTGGSNAGGGAGGVGSTHTGGAGATASIPGDGGGGGGSSAGTAANGNNGSTNSGNSGGAGGAAPTGGAAGAAGGNAPSGNGANGASGGGGGGGGPQNYNTGYNRAGGAGGPGRVELTYTSSGGGTLANNNVIRFVMHVPRHGGNNGKVLIRALTSGTIGRVDVQYRTGGNIRMFGYTSGGTQLFDSGNLSVGADGTTLMVSAELAASGANVAYAFSAIVPGAGGVVAKTSGTVTTATMGNVTEVLAGPNADISKTAIGHISVQYALIPLWMVSDHLNGHDTEAGLDRFIRICTEQAMGNITEVNEGADHWGFESGTESWTANNGTLTQSSFSFGFYPLSVWPTEGSNSLLMTANGAGQPAATSPTGTSGQPVLPGDIVSVSADVFSSNTGGLSNVYVGVKFYTAAGASISQSNSPDLAIGQDETHTLRWAPVAPATSAFFAVVVGDHFTETNGTLFYIDHVRVSPQMGRQESKEHRALLEEIKDLDQGMLKEAKTLWGLGYRTRIKLIFQSPAVTLDYSQGTVSPPFAPVVDIQNVKNDITVKHKKGSKVNVSLTSGAMSVLEPPQGTGRHRKHLKAAVHADEQLLALANHLLNLGTNTDERYPTITVELTRAGILNNAVAPLMSAVAGVDIGDFVKVTNVPFFYPSNPVKQLVIGYTETIDMDERRWVITWNCVPESQWEISATSIRRW